MEGTVIIKSAREDPSPFTGRDESAVSRVRVRFLRRVVDLSDRKGRHYVRSLTLAACSVVVATLVEPCLGDRYAGLLHTVLCFRLHAKIVRAPFIIYLAHVLI